MRRRKESDKLRDMAHPVVLGYELDRRTLLPVQTPLPETKPGEDYGCDPLGEIDGVFRWRMVPSGDVVDAEERQRRLARFDVAALRDA